MRGPRIVVRVCVDVGVFCFSVFPKKKKGRVLGRSGFVVWRSKWAADTTLISTSHCDGSGRPGTVNTDGAALVVGRRRKERTYPELPSRKGQVGAFCIRLGDHGGKRSCHVQVQKVSRGLCWSCAPQQALTATHQRPMMCCGILRAPWRRPEHARGVWVTKFSVELCVGCNWPWDCRNWLPCLHALCQCH